MKKKRLEDCLTLSSSYENYMEILTENCLFEFERQT